MKRLFLCAMVLGLAGCEPQPVDPVIVKRSGGVIEPDLIYYRDTRANLCFMGGARSYVLVPCTPEVLVLTGGKQ